MSTMRCECVPMTDEAPTTWRWPARETMPMDEPARRTRRKAKIPKACRAALSRCMARGTLKQRKARAGSCMRAFQRCRRKAKR